MAVAYFQLYHRPKQHVYMIVGLLLSLCLHIGLLQWNPAHATVAHKPKMQLTEVVLLHETMPKQPTMPKAKVKQPVAKKVVKPQPKAQPTPQRRRVVIYRKQAKHIAKKLLKNTQHSNSKAMKKPVHAVTKQSITPSPKSSHTSAPKVPTAIKQLYQKNYVSVIMASIQAHKIYPYSARRRHMEGQVQVSFFINAQGQVYDLQIKGASSVLRLATKQAVDDAVPFPKPSQPKIQVHFVMQYVLK